MRRKLFTLAAGVSAGLGVAVCALWVRSYWRHDAALFADVWVSSTHGWLVVLTRPSGMGFWMTDYRAPHALVAFVLALPALASMLWDWRRRQLARLCGCCHHCGYDLRATPERCPECGRMTG